MKDLDFAAKAVRELLDRLLPDSHAGARERMGTEIEQCDDYFIDWQH